MTYRRFAWREIGWGGAAVLAGIGLAGCPGGGGGGGCPELEGTWQVQSDCTGGPSSCDVQQDKCEITLVCNNGKTYEGKASKSSVSFKDEEVSCSGKLDDLEDEDEDGVIYPQIEADCTIAEGGGMCEVEAFCGSGIDDCNEPEDDSNDGGEGGSAGANGGMSGGFSGVGGASGGFGGQGGFSGEGPAGQGGFSGGGSGGFGGIGGSGGSGGVGGSVSGACGQCVDSSCSSERAACNAAVECGILVDCVLESGCAGDDESCLESYCAARLQNVVLDEQDQIALSEFDDCATTYCSSSCGGGEPMGGTGGVGGDGGFGGTGGTGGSEPQPCDTCVWANDDYCDEGVDCEYGTDCSDCGSVPEP